MRLRLLYFAVVRERLGIDGELVELPAATVSSLLDELIRRHPPLGALRATLKVAVNQEFCEGSCALRDGDEVALIPPVSGGSDLCRISDAPLSLDEVVRAVTDEGHGAIATFTGVVRRSSHNRRVLRLDYEAYRPMAERAMAAIIQQLAVELPGVRLAMVHRVGQLAVGELAVVIAASAPHRREALTACRAAIDRLKERVPIWKKEICEDGEHWGGGCA